MDFKQYRIAVVDDDTNALDTYNLFHSEFFTIRTFVHSYNFLEALEKEYFHIFILDYYLDVYNGGELLQKIKENPIHQNSYFISHSCEVNKKTILTILDYGFDEYLQKPIDIEMSIDRLKKILLRNGKKLVSNLNMKITFDDNMVYINGVNSSLTPKESLIFKTLCEERRYVSSAELHYLVYGTRCKEKYSSTINSHISNIRLKFNTISPHTEIIETDPSYGYKIRIVVQ